MKAIVTPCRQAVELVDNTDDQHSERGREQQCNSIHFIPAAEPEQRWGRGFPHFDGDTQCALG